MKKMISLFLSLLLLLSISVPSFALSADDIDLSGLSYEELVRLRDRINLAMWESSEWEEVEVPIGVWQVGADIPAGHWTIAAADGVWCTIARSRFLDSTGKEVEFGSGSNYFSEILTHPDNSTYDPKTDPVSVDLVLSDGEYLVVDTGNVVFTPYAGKASLGFKGNASDNSGSKGNSSGNSADKGSVSAKKGSSGVDTSVIVGDWSAIEVVIDGESDTSSYLCSQLSARINADGSGYLYVADNRARLNWTYLRSDEECHIFNYTVGSDESGFFYFTDPAHEYYRNLIVLIDEETMIVYEKD